MTRATGARARAAALGGLLALSLGAGAALAQSVKPSQPAPPPAVPPTVTAPSATPPAPRAPAKTPAAAAAPAKPKESPASPAGSAQGPAGAPTTSGIFGTTAQENGVPVAVEADQGIEWLQERQVYIAHGNAKAVRGEVTVYGQTLTAYYRKTPSGGSDIWRLEAEDNVKITTPTDTAVGDRAVYDVDNGIFVLTGKKLQLDTPKAVITARDSLEYWQQKEYAVARGNAKAVREDKTVSSNVMTAHFKRDQKGELQMSNIEAFENVLITTPSAVARAMYSDYNLDTSLATLKGSVKITRGQDQLDGECADVNINTGISRLFSCAKQDRVRGLLVPKQGGGPGAGGTAPLGGIGGTAPRK